MILIMTPNVMENNVDGSNNNFRIYIKIDVKLLLLKRINVRNKSRVSSNRQTRLL